MRVLWSFAIYLLTLTPTCLFFFFFNDTATTEIYTLSLHDALPISFGDARQPGLERAERLQDAPPDSDETQPGQKHTDRKSTRLNSSHGYISYAVFCLKKKKKTSQLTNMVKTQTDPGQSAVVSAFNC